MMMIKANSGVPAAIEFYMAMANDCLRRGLDDEQAACELWAAYILARKHFGLIPDWYPVDLHPWKP